MFPDSQAPTLFKIHLLVVDVSLSVSCRQQELMISLEQGIKSHFYSRKYCESPAAVHPPDILVGTPKRIIFKTSYLINITS